MTDILDVRTGTIVATGPTLPVFGSIFDVKITFAGTASVDVEELMSDGTWIKAAVAIIANYRSTFGIAGSPQKVMRLNCTAFTDAATYDIIAKDQYMVERAKALGI